MPQPSEGSGRKSRHIIREAPGSHNSSKGYTYAQRTLSGSFLSGEGDRLLSEKQKPLTLYERLFFFAEDFIRFFALAFAVLTPGHSTLQAEGQTVLGSNESSFMTLSQSSLTSDTPTTTPLENMASCRSSSALSSRNACTQLFACKRTFAHILITLVAHYYEFKPRRRCLGWAESRRSLILILWADCRLGKRWRCQLGLCKSARVSAA